MALLDAAVAITHLVFAGVWTGSVVFVALAVRPLAASGDLDAGPLSAVASSLKTLTRASAVLLLLTGGHLAGTRYTAESLFGSTNGHLVLSMLVLWFALATLVEIGAGRLQDGADRRKVREPAREAARPLQAAAVVAVLLLINGGLLLA